MPFLLINQKVNDFDQWRTAFDGNCAARRAAGLIDLHVLRDEKDPNHVVLMLGTADVQRAREFAESSDTRALLRQSGVVGEPQIAYLHEAESC